TVTNCYYDCSWTYGYGGTSSDDDSATKLMSTDDMQEPSFALTLYNNAYSYNLNNSTAPQACAWKVGDNGYPALAYNTTPTNLLFSGGEGTKDYPYLISTSDDLRELSTIVNLGLKDFSEQYLEMTADIDLEGYNMANEFTAIGSTATPFKGNFNGNGHSISDIYILAIPMALDTGEGNYQGLFGYISGATITDVHMVGGYISGYSYVGAVVGQAYYSSVTNCSSSTSVFGTVAVASGQESRAAHVGGVVGQAYNSTVSGCCYTGNEVSGYEKTGGVVGSAISGSTITNCYNRANYVTSTQNAGGVVGYLLESYLYNSYSATNDISSGLYIGGVAGSISSSTVHNCYFDITLLPNWAAVSHFDTSGTSISNATGWSTENMTDGKFAEILGGSWKEDTGGINDGYPILTWQ
ncbi:MAG: GLUG motif-containing protein, partial [Rikenellaceae bacterium]